MPMFAEGISSASEAVLHILSVATVEQINLGIKKKIEATHKLSYHAVNF